MYRIQQYESLLGVKVFRMARFQVQFLYCEMMAVLICACVGKNLSDALLFCHFPAIL